MSRRPSPRPFLVHDGALTFAHRGGSLVWPENTLQAFRGALDAGCSHLETDLHLTKDGTIVCHHDAELDRTTDGTGLLKARTYTELQRLDAGYRFTVDGKTFPFRGRGLTIPTFESVYALSPTVRVNIEVKQREPSMIAALWSYIEKHRVHDRILVAAHDDRLVREFRRVSGGRVATSAGMRESLVFLGAARLRAARLLRPRYDALQIPVRSGPIEIATPRLIDAAHRLGIQVHVWTIDDRHEMNRLLSLGVDGLMSDRPDLLVDVVGRSAGNR